jgi:hypothetical protein
VLVRGLFFLALLAGFLACEQPFRAGLGPVEDARRPTITLETPTAGKYIYGVPLFKGTAADDYKLDRVEFKVTGHSGLNGVATNPWAEYTTVILDLTTQNQGKWSKLDFDTTVYKDGPLNIQLRVWDSHNKSAETDEIAFFIKNEPTAIDMTGPAITRGEDSGEVGGLSLNYEKENTRDGISYVRKLPKGDPITGTISHDEGIYTGPVSGDKFPPQIRLWRVNDMVDPADTEGYEPGVIPPLGEVPWDNLNMMVVGIGSYIFNYDFSEKEKTNKTACFYGFEIRAQNEDGRSSFHYPRDFYLSGTDWESDEYKYISYVLFYYSPDNETPVVDIYELEDIQAYWNSSGSAYPYPSLGVTDEQAHPYINNLTVDKNGAFKLRIKASHSEGIGAAEVYWEQKESNTRGRFIWDFEAEGQNPGDSRWDLDVTKPYNQWGYREPYPPYINGGKPTYRSFFFHYRHDPAYHIPGGVWSGAAGRPQVQQYRYNTGVEDDAWKAGKESGSLVRDTAAWIDVPTGVLKDGTYKLEVYARTPALGNSKKLLEINIKLDTKAPEVSVSKVNKVEGQSVFVPDQNREYIVNGVIQPEMSFKDPVDDQGSGGAGRRLATTGNYFKNSVGAQDYEQFFILVADGEKSKLEAKITKDWWPVDTVAPAPTGAVGLITSEVTGIDIKRNGPVFDNAVKIKTSPIYSFPPQHTGNDATDALADGKYSVYVFSRDNAFNVGYTRIALDVKKDTDIPILDFSAGAIKRVTNPNVIESNEYGFLYDGVVRNKLAGGSSIRLTIKDDDSLDLVSATGVTIQFTGSYTDALGEIKPRTDQVTLTDTQIKAIFLPLQTAGTAAPSRQGEILQNVLVTRLKATPAYNSIFLADSYPANGGLPDGMYYFTITINDYPAVKMRMDTPTALPVAASASESFWIVVDSKPPKYELAVGSAQPEQFLPNGIIGTIKGTVSDENGPVTILSCNVFDSNGNKATNIVFGKTSDPVRNTGITNTWSGVFNTTVDMKNESGRFRFEITFEDRFGNTSTLTQYLQADNEKPTAVIGNPIPTFERDYPDVVTSPDTSENKKRLANGVLNFRISASDNNKVKEVKWWLVAGDNPTPPTELTYGTYTGAKNGTLDGTTGKEFNAMQFIDSTAGVTDGVYTLFVMAKDTADNISVLESNSRQTIYILREQDKPYFGYWDGVTGSPPITPANGMVTADATIRGSIYDDDSFDNAASPVGVLAESVKIWMSAQNTMPAGEPNDTFLSNNNFGTAMTYNPAGGTGNFTTGVSRSGKGILSINNINLAAEALFGNNVMGTDGIKHYVIEAKDSYVGKYTPTGGAAPATDRETRRKLFTFVYDTKNPVISLAYPVSPTGNTKTFGKTANIDEGGVGSESAITSSNLNFHLEGTLSDANLQQTENNYYYFYYYLGSGERKQFILDTTKPGIFATSTLVLGDTVVKFTVSAAAFCAETALNFDTVASDTHTLTLVAQDKSGREGVCTFTFIKDTAPPTLEIIDPANTRRLPQIRFQPSGGSADMQDWWYTPPPAQAQAWYKDRRTWETNNALPRIDYSTGVPTLKITVDDAISTIAKTMYYWIDDESVPRELTYPDPARKNVSWTIDLTKTNGTALDDGIHSIRFEAADSVGNKLESTASGGQSTTANGITFDYNGNMYYGFRINSRLPTVDGTMPGTPPGTRNVYGIAPNMPNANNFFTIDVKAEGYNLQNARLRIKYPNGLYYTTGGIGYVTLTPTANNGNWNFDNATKIETLTWATQGITRTMLGGGTVAPGDYELQLTAVGIDGKESDPAFIWNFTIDADAAAPSTDKAVPSVAINEFPAAAMLADTVTNVAPNQWTNLADKKVFTSPTQRIQGEVSDAHSNLKNVQILIQRYNYGAGQWANYYTKTGDETGNWTSTTEFWNELLADGETTRKKIVDVTLGSIEGIANGLYRVRLRAKDSSYVTGSTAWTPATDDGHPTLSNYYYFFYAAPSDSSITFADADRTLFSAAVVANGRLTFTGTAASPSLNGYANMTVSVTRNGVPLTTANSSITGIPKTDATDWSPVSRNWTAALTFPTDDDGSKDGAYRLTFTVTDWAGREYSQSRTITLDNTPPKGIFTAPELLPAAVRDTGAAYANGSETFYGGEDAVIAGTAEDTNGLAGIWYHLGYTQNVPASGRVNSPGRLDVIRTVLTGATDDKGGDANNAAFDAAAHATGANSTAWFKYTNDKYTDNTDYPRPDISGTNGFFELPADILLYAWELKIPYDKNLSRYTQTGITIKGRSYNGANQRMMAQQLKESTVAPTLPLAYQKSDGLYSIPLWIRVADIAGNVTYFRQDIWVYPNGDYPTNAINNPSDRATLEANARGGTVTFDGIASDNVNVKSVIYRIRADNIQNNAAGWQDAPTGAAASQYIIPIGAQRIESGQPEWEIFYAEAQKSGANITNTNNWFRATLEQAETLGKSKSWSFYVNANNEFTTKTGPDNLSPIERWGFPVNAPNMIRVYVEILVFDGANLTSYNKMSLGENNPGILAKPDVRVFYLSNTAPQITDLKFSNADAFYNTATTPTAAAYSVYPPVKPANTNTRSKRFAVQMTLNGSGRPIKLVQVRLPSEAGQGGDLALATWRDVWNNTGRSQGLDGVTLNPANPVVGTQSFTMIYAFDTTITNPITGSNGYAPVMGGTWNVTGGRYVIEVRLRDNNDAEATYQFEIGVDNFAPVADEVRVISNRKVAGSNQYFQGRVYDYSGSNSNPQPGYFGVDRVYAWFTKSADGASDYINLNTSGVTPTLPAASMTSIPAYTGRHSNSLDIDTVANVTLSSEGTPGTSTYPNPANTASSQYVKVISEATQGTTVYWQPITAGRSVNWSFMQDTMIMPDGPIYLHYIVVDSAGNATKYRQDMVVMNNYPIITDLTLYTDNTGQGAVFTTHEDVDARSDYKVEPSMIGSAGYLNSGFISKNSYIGFGLTVMDTGKLNKPLNYRVQYVNRTEVTLDTGGLAAIAADIAQPAASRTYSNIYTIKSKGTMSDTMWATLMDVPKVTAVEGMHFAFKTTAGLSASTAVVYRYQQVGNLKREKTGLNTVTISDKDYKDEAYGGGFRFETTSDFGTGVTVITEKNGSHPPGEGGGTNNSADTAFFLIKVWDTVNGLQPGQPGYNEDDMLYDAMVVGMNVYISDSNPPTSRLYDLNPYTQVAVVGNNIGAVNQTATIHNAADPVAIGSNIVRGGLYNKGTRESDLVKSGYINPRNGSKALTPKIKNSDGQWVDPDEYPLFIDGDDVGTGSNPDKVSGRIILRGLAWDDQLIDEILVNINNVGAKAILKLQPITEDGKTVMRMLPVGDTLAYAVEELHWKTGHTVEWAYVWDTEKEPASANSGPLNNVTVAVTVKDNIKGLISPSRNLSDENGDTIFHNTVTVDIVPYITGFERKTPQFTTKRSLQGWYSFYQGESDIGVLGYNFGTSTVSMTLKGTTLTPVSGSSSSRRTFSIPATAASGGITLTANGTLAHNNNSTLNTTTGKSWNREYNSYTPGSDLWINRPYAHIWRSSYDEDSTPRTYIGTNVSSQGLAHPGMALEYNSDSPSPGTLHGTWAAYGRANVFYGTNANASYALHGPATPGEPFGTPDISIFNGGGASPANMPNIGYSRQPDGRSVLLVKAAVTTQSNADTPPASTVLQAYGANGSTQRWQNIRISKAAANTVANETDTQVGRIYMSSYNADITSLWYGSRINGGSNNNGTNNVMFIDGGGALDTTTSIPTSGLTATGNAGEYSAVDYDSTGPIIAYYDQTNDTVRVALGLNPTPTNAAGQWNRVYLLPSTRVVNANGSSNGSELRTGSGKFISIKVDKSNGIHLAFYNSAKNTMVYYYASSRANLIGVTAANPTVVPNAGENVKVFTVDNVVKGGTWTDISVDDYGNPWIVYGDSSRTENYDGVRMAYKSSSNTGTQFSGALTCPVTKANITGWEALTMPSNYTVENDRLNIEAWPPTNRAGGILGTRTDTWNAAIGYANKISGFRVAYFYYPQP